MYVEAGSLSRRATLFLVLALVSSLIIAVICYTNVAYAQKETNLAPVVVSEVVAQGEDLLVTLQWEGSQIPTTAWLEVSDKSGAFIIIDDGILIGEISTKSGDQRMVIPQALAVRDDGEIVQRNFALFDGDSGKPLLLVGLQVENGKAQLVAPWSWSNNCPAKWLTGTAGDDLLAGVTGFANYIFGLGGHDQIWGQSCDDRLYGMAGDDTIFGEAGDDVISGAGGNDRLWGNPGNNRVWGGQGNDLIYGGDGNDSLQGGDGNDTIYGLNGNDTQLLGGAGNDTIFGGNGDDYIDGGPGFDTCNGEGGTNNIFVNCEVVDQ